MTAAGAGRAEEFLGFLQRAVLGTTTDIWRGSQLIWDWFFHLDAAGWTAAFTVVLSLATIILAFATVRLWQSTERLVRSDEAHSAAAIRAYLNLTGLVNELDANGAGAFTMKFQNSGQSPALNVIAGYGLLADVSGTTPEEQLPFSNDEDLLANGVPEVIGSRADMPLGAEVPPDKTDATKAALVGGRLYAYGVVTYQDVFGEHHKTRFRLVRDPKEGNSFKSSRFGNSST